MKERNERNEGVLFKTDDIRYLTTKTLFVNSVAVPYSSTCSLTRLSMVSAYSDHSIYTFPNLIPNPFEYKDFGINVYKIEDLDMKTFGLSNQKITNDLDYRLRTMQYLASKQMESYIKIFKMTDNNITLNILLSNYEGLVYGGDDIIKLKNDFGEYRAGIYVMHDFRLFESAFEQISSNVKYINPDIELIRLPITISDYIQSIEINK